MKARKTQATTQEIDFASLMALLRIKDSTSRHEELPQATPTMPLTFMLQMHRSGWDFHAMLELLDKCILTKIPERAAIKALGIVFHLTAKRTHRNNKPFQSLFARHCTIAASQRHENVEKLKNHLYRYEYDQVKALINQDPTLLTVKTVYHPNHWTVSIKGSITLGIMISALEYVWRIGDPVFTALFDDYLTILPKSAEENRTQCEAISKEQCRILANYLQRMADHRNLDHLRPHTPSLWESSGDFVNASMNFCYQAPTWLYGLQQFILNNRLYLAAGTMAKSSITISFKSCTANIAKLRAPELKYLENPQSKKSYYLLIDFLRTFSATAILESTSCSTATI